MSNPETIKAATRISERLQSEKPVELDPVVILSLLTDLLPALMTCFGRSQNRSTEKMQEEIRKRYDEEKGQFDDDFVRKVAVQVQWRARATGVKTPINRDQAMRIATAVLTEAILESSQGVVGSSAFQAVFEEAGKK